MGQHAGVVKDSDLNVHRAAALKGAAVGQGRPGDGQGLIGVNRERARAADVRLELEDSALDGQ